MTETKKVIGAVAINKLFVEHYNNYECAAWWEDREAQIGIYPIILKKQYLYPHHLYGEYKIPAKVVDDYFPALWGGVTVSNKPYTPKHVGEAREIICSVNLVEAIRKTGISPGQDKDFYLDPRFWDLALDEAENELNNMLTYLSESVDKRKCGDDEFRSALSAIGYSGENIHKRAKEIDEVLKCRKYHQDPGFQKLYKKNYEWAIEYLNKLVGYSID